MAKLPAVPTIADNPFLLLAATGICLLLLLGFIFYRAIFGAIDAPQQREERDHPEAQKPQ